MTNPVQAHYQCYPYPNYPLLASVRRCDTYALNLQTLWARFNRSLPPPEANNILIAGSGTFAPYPWGVANPDVSITALDLSERSLKRARWHCILHGQHNVVFKCGDLTDRKAINGKFGLIDSFGVLHHLEDPLAGLRSLERHLVTGGIMRIMLYSRYARQEEESIRRALKLIGVRTPNEARRVMARARAGSRLARYVSAADEVETDSGIADALLHPVVRTFLIDEVLEMLQQTELVPLLFAHSGALEDVREEIIRLRALEKERRSPGNFIIYLGNQAPSTSDRNGDSLIMLNPCLSSVVSYFTIGETHIPDRIGCGVTTLGRRERLFLKRFLKPVFRSTLSGDLTKSIDVYKRALLLLEYFP